MRTFALATLAAIASASKSDFPSDAWNHAGCHVQATFDASCDALYKQVDAEIKAWNPEPLSTPGYYSLKEEATDDYIWSTRLTYNKKYTDDQLFEFVNGTDSSCTIKGRSRSQSFSMLDNGVNYCNLWNVFNGIKSAGIASSFSVDKVSSCSVKPSNPTETCARY